MPLPAYLICCEGVSVDREANKITAFNVCEQIHLIDTEQLRRHTAERAAQNIPPLTMGGPTLVRIVSTWLKENTDTPDVRYETQFAFLFPGQADEIVVGQVEIRFDATFHRVTTPPTFIPGFPEPGILRIESRIRRVGDADWLHRQFFYI